MNKLSEVTDLLMKFSKLTDQQYNQILKDSNKIKQLEQVNLLDSYYRSRPDKTEKELMDQINFQKSIKKEPSKISINNPKVLNFISVFGNMNLPREILFRIAKAVIPADEVIYSESISENRLVRFVNILSDFKIKDIIDSYYKFVKYSDKNIIDFIDYLEELEDLNYKKEKAEINNQSFSKEDQNSINELTKKVSKILYVILNQINEISNIKIEQPLEDVVLKKLEESLKLKQSDMFDFVFENNSNYPEKIV